MKKVDPFVYPPENFAMVAQGVRAAPHRFSRTSRQHGSVGALNSNWPLNPCYCWGALWQVFRGSFPPKKALGFMKRLKLRSVVYLCPEEPPAYYLEFMRQVFDHLATIA